MTVTLPDPERSDWLAWRRTGIGGSDVAGVLNLSPWVTPYQVWLDKTDGLPDEPTMAMRLGQVLEPFILGEYEERTGLYALARQRRSTHAEHSHHLATIDAAAWDHAPAFIAEQILDGAVELVEAKAVSDRNWDEVPIYYYVQAQWQLHVTGLAVCTFAVLHDRRHVELYPVERDDDDIAEIVAAVDQFWTDHVLAGTAPDVTAADLDATRWAHRAYTPASTRIADAGLEGLLDQLHAAKSAVAEAQRLEDTLTARLIAAIGDTEQITDAAGQKLATYKPNRTFDLDAAVAEHADEAVAARALDIAEFKRLLGKKRTDQFMVDSPDGARRLYIPKRKDPK